MYHITHAWTIRVDDDAEISINAEVANGKIATSHIATSHIAESTSVGFVRERPIENDANVVEGDDKWQLRVVQESCRTNFLRQSWFESTLPTGDILDRCVGVSLLHPIYLCLILYYLFFPNVIMVFQIYTRDK